MPPTLSNWEISGGRLEPRPTLLNRPRSFSLTEAESSRGPIARSSTTLRALVQYSTLAAITPDRTGSQRRGRSRSPSSAAMAIAATWRSPSSSFLCRGVLGVARMLSVRSTCQPCLADSCSSNETVCSGRESERESDRSVPWQQLALPKQQGT